MGDHIIHFLRILGGKFSNFRLIVRPRGHRAKSDRKISCIFNSDLVISRVAVNIDDVREDVLRNRHWENGSKKGPLFGYVADSWLVLHRL